MNKMNCAEQVKKIFPLLQKQPDLYHAELECEDNWDEDYACFLVYLMEEEFRDYDAVEKEVIRKITSNTEQKVTLLFGLNCKYPNSGYVLQVHRLGGGLTLEFELYRMKKK